jgi:cytochrome c553
MPPIRSLVVLLGLLVTMKTPTAAVAADVEAGRRKAEACVPCHGPGGRSTNPAIPSLAGQPSLYTHWQLILFRDGRRRDPQMTPLAASLADTDLEDLAAYYAAEPPAPPRAHAGPAVAEAGRRLVAAHHCDSCHRPRLDGQNQVPRIAGQPYEYLLAQLRGFRAQTRGELDGTMTSAARPLSDEEIETLARYIASLP